MDGTMATLERDVVESRAMTRCECAAMAFAEVARVMRECGLSLADVTRESGCGQTCTACLPDLQRYLATRPEGRAAP